MFSVARLTRRLKLTSLGGAARCARLGVVTNSTAAAAANSPVTMPVLATAISSNGFSESFVSQQSRGFATGNRKKLEAKIAKRLKIQAKKKKNANRPGASKTTDDSSGDAARSNEPFLQHQEWVKFQQSITVDGFETGQTVVATAMKKSRGGKQARKRREKELERLQQQSTDTDLKYPAIRYSPEETEDLLKMAYAALPERAGKRGTNNLRRQARRWKLVRDIRAKYKRNIIAAHERRMEKRKWKRDCVKQMKDEIAPEARVKDIEYQNRVLTRWADTMFGIKEIEASSGSEAAVGVSGGEGGKTIGAKE